MFGPIQYSSLEAFLAEFFRWSGELIINIVRNVSRLLFVKQVILYIIIHFSQAYYTDSVRFFLGHRWSPYDAIANTRVSKTLNSWFESSVSLYMSSVIIACAIYIVLLILL